MDRAPTFELDVLEERQRQDEKWGTQRHGGNLWLTILVEEVGEISRVLLEDLGPNLLRRELIQVAAVCRAWVEHIEEALEEEPRP
ncbi:hypothetical protein LCGC14_1057930 [marine sediment metagenome]|uniref:NTP pyrophosphohydrolase MazG putative catalytic core domain-containing protein n=1 Tax=marine sediment metagenome TaxID=412755 RepID=A0A0F9MM62_9ZZZZ